MTNRNKQRFVTPSFGKQGLRWLLGLGLMLVAVGIGYRLGLGSTTSPTSPETESAEVDQDAWYTCSMHPSVRSRDPDGKCPICSMDLIPVDQAERQEQASKGLSLSELQADAARVRATRVQRRFPTAEVRLFGKITYDQTRVARLTAYIPGRVERLFVNYVGVPVRQGDHMAEFYSPELISAFEELKQVQDTLKRLGAGGSTLIRESTRRTLTAARERLQLFGMTDEQITSIEKGQQPTERLTIHAPIGGVVTHLAVREGDYVGTGEPIATVADLSRLWLDLEAYESQLPLLRWGMTVRFTVEALPGESFEGKVAFIEPVINPMTRTAAVRVAVDNRNGDLKPGMFATAVALPQLSESGIVPDASLTGRWVSPMHPTVVKDGPGQCDVCGMDLVPVEELGIIDTDQPVTKPLVIPASAVLFTGRRSLVYLASEQAEGWLYEPREIILGPRAGEDYVVGSGLDEGQLVVTHGSFRIDSAMQIAARPSMMSPDEEDDGESHQHRQQPQANTGTSATKTVDPAERAEAPKASGLSESENLMPVYNAYFTLQQALASDDLQAAQEARTQLRASAEALDEKIRSETDQNLDLHILKPLIESRSADSLESLRDEFEPISDAVIRLESRLGHTGSATWYRAHCPMAFDNRGADWLQRDPTISNPYFGAMMLGCGEIRETLEPIEPAKGHEAHDHE
ncbi:MAG: efflux RND transporter periplasmic adaptor subunit [Phycisphaeraceae bacterium]